ncbi:MAG: exonuclease SbcCD subunit D [Bryobacterales bacterium]|nr:exonuclease SbcCD subunit D [Bryobacterales bacterium]
MLFLHTSDWHVGRSIAGRSRLSEHEAVAAEILGIADRERIDALLFSGDLYDSAAPGPEAERLVYEFFAELLRRGIRAVLIGGNHDHPKRLAALRELLDPLGIFLRAEPARADAGGVVAIEARGERALIASLPFVPERRIVTIARMVDPEEQWSQTYSDAVARMGESLCSGFSPETVNILMAHLYVFEAKTSGSERAVHVAAPYAVSAARFPVSAQYIALGHLHRPQEVSGQPPAWYAGSPLQLDFGERGQRKRAVLVEAKPGRPARLESVPLSAGRELREVEGTLDELLGGDYGDAYLRVRVQTDGPDSSLHARVCERLPNAVEVRAEYATQEPSQAETLEELEPVELFRAYYHQARGVAPSEELEAAFRDLYHEVGG